MGMVFALQASAKDYVDEKSAEMQQQQEETQRKEEEERSRAEVVCAHGWG